MDDANDEPTARAPEFSDLLKLCRALNEQGAEYLVIGGFAVMLHGGGRFTKDIDLLVRETEENIRKIKKAMAILPDNAAAQIADDDVARYQVVRIGDEFVVDLMAAACGIWYEQAKQ
ncbi:MAG: nucleotidyltransferase, partial [Elusimicrobia bacterium]|nr:nucleotidyltransferase [Elusimicrobiota bacterium]